MHGIVLSKAVDGSKMTDRREIEAVRFLYLADSFVSADALADHIHVKPRTLRELMNHIREEMRDNGADLLLKSNRGYCLEIHDPEVFMRYLKRQSKWAREQQFDRPVTVEDRCDWIIRRLLLDSSVSSWDELADPPFHSAIPMPDMADSAAVPDGHL